MLQLTITPPEQWDSKNQVFVYPKGTVLTLEHSLVSLSKWESKWCKPFISRVEKTHEESIDYIRCMTITQNVDPKIYDYVSAENLREVEQYIEAPMTATWFSEEKTVGPKSGEQITSELIYYWMIALEIPSEYQKWHLNRLLTLIRVCNVKNQKPKKMSQREHMDQRRALNAARKKQFNTRG